MRSRQRRSSRRQHGGTSACAAPITRTPIFRDGWKGSARRNGNGPSSSSNTRKRPKDPKRRCVFGRYRFSPGLSGITAHRIRTRRLWLRENTISLLGRESIKAIRRGKAPAPPDRLIAYCRLFTRTTHQVACSFRPRRRGSRAGRGRHGSRTVCHAPADVEPERRVGKRRLGSS